jgi:hypothetical protein
LFLVAGCSGPHTPIVEGTVTLNGYPVDGGKIAFFPTGNSPGVHSGSAQTDIRGGKYILERKELAPGTYRVEVYWWKKTGKKVPSSDLPVDQKIQLIPQEFNTFSSLKTEITAGTTNKDFQLVTSDARLRGRKRT